jgi:hypothetical protein
MAMLERNFVLIVGVTLAFVVGAALVHLRARCPACGWKRHERVPARFKYRGAVEVRRAARCFWAVSVLGAEPILLCSRVAALEFAIGRLVDAQQQGLQEPSSAKSTGGNSR